MGFIPRLYLSAIHRYSAPLSSLLSAIHRYSVPLSSLLSAIHRYSTPLSSLLSAIHRYTAPASLIAVHTTFLIASISDPGTVIPVTVQQTQAVYPYDGVIYTRRVCSSCKIPMYLKIPANVSSFSLVPPTLSLTASPSPLVFPSQASTSQALQEQLCWREQPPLLPALPLCVSVAIGVGKEVVGEGGAGREWGGEWEGE
ncbi:unnamed protein product [Closterium sp. Naga37s-1]|nr:unnamed protein product [Closterium sp. Naga37s-1]